MRKIKRSMQQQQQQEKNNNMMTDHLKKKSHRKTSPRIVFPCQSLEKKSSKRFSCPNEILELINRKKKNSKKTKKKKLLPHFLKRFFPGSSSSSPGESQLHPGKKINSYYPRIFP
ncbi:hypothetical protein CEXT_679671 [Caerostris extrusa]|uniref:Uncharacterized protein n=1 Tax=Caerostris extrusa TaxID=172846 RepID=A0AAV4NUA3_CAEEX|nr:hypothetical protein CEXT_679671 [Caerostris extrusa]